MNLAEKIDRNRRTAERFLYGTHSKDIANVSVIDDTVSSGIVCHGFPGMTIRDKESYKDFFRVFRQSFSDMDWKVHALVADENYVSARWQIWATHSGDFAGVKPDGRRITFDGMVLYRLEDGLITETWLHINELQLLEQIGALGAGASQAAQ
jgi:predicted ester cyclase